MIALGFSKKEKIKTINDIVSRHDIERVVMLSPEKFTFPLKMGESIDWPEIIMYRTFYRLLQEIDSKTLVIVNECLRTQNRYDLTYNCIRHFLNQAGHQLVFQWLPIIDSIEDFMILFDFDTRSQWKRQKFDKELLVESQIRIKRKSVAFTDILCLSDEKLQAAYTAKKEKLIAELESKDPNTIPRNLYLLSGKARMQRVEPFDQWYVARNQRFKQANFQTYKEPEYLHNPYIVFEFPHNLSNFSDFMCLSEQHQFKVLSSDLPVDQWYLSRYQEWAKRVEDGYASLS